MTVRPIALTRKRKRQKYRKKKKKTKTKRKKKKKGSYKALYVTRKRNYEPTDDVISGDKWR